MIYAKKRANNTTRVVGLGIVVLMNVLVGYALATGLGQQIVDKIIQTEVAIIETPDIEEEEPPPPPPPVDVDLPPPPPEVILPDIVFDTPPPPNAIQQVAAVDTPRPPPVKAPPAPPAPPPPAVIVKKPEMGSAIGELMAQYYPAASQRAKEEGTAKVSVCIGTDGRVSDVKLLGSTGFPRLDEATLKSLPRVRGKPARDSNNKPVAACPYVFDLVWQMPKD